MLRRTFLAAISASSLLTCKLLPAAEPKAKDKADDVQWQPLFNGKNLDGWKVTNFGGEGEVAVKDGELLIEMGQPMSGVAWKKKEPPHKQNYEIRLEAKRTKGSDFFCGLTVPCGDSHCSFIVGGWGGGLVGISSINNADASENSTSSYHEFKNDKWYKLRMRVEPKRIQCWIDDKQVVDVDIADQKVSTRIEVDESKPLGIATYETACAIRKLEIRPLKEKK